MNEMTRRERILAAIDHKPTDRIPTDYWGVPEMTAKLEKALNIRPGDWKDFAEKLDIDKVMTVEPVLTADRQNVWDVTYRKVPLPYGDGYYDEPVKLPIAEYETIEEIEANYIFPTTDMFDYSTIAEQCKQYEGYAIEGGYISLTYFYECIRGTEQMCIDFLAYPEIAEYILDRLEEFHYEHVKKMLEAAQGKIDIVQVTDDFGSQNSLLLSPEMIDHFFAKHYEKNIQLVKSYGARVFHHDDGAMTSLIPWLLDKGIEILNPLQWHLPGWDLKDLKQQFGDRLCFHGGIDNQHVLPFGTPEEVRREVFTCCEQLTCDGTGYIMAPCHNVQANTSVENVLAMYQAVRDFQNR